MFFHFTRIVLVDFDLVAYDTYYLYDKLHYVKVVIKSLGWQTATNGSVSELRQRIWDALQPNCPPMSTDDSVWVEAQFKSQWLEFDGYEQTAFDYSFGLTCLFVLVES